jgi:hypothetical protein
MPNRDPCPLLIEWLREEREDGVDLTPEDFAQRAAMACKATGAGRAWLWVLADTYPQWRSAYRREPAGWLEHFALDLEDYAT